MWQPNCFLSSVFLLDLAQTTWGEWKGSHWCQWAGIQFLMSMLWGTREQRVPLYCLCLGDFNCGSGAKQHLCVKDRKGNVKKGLRSAARQEELPVSENNEETRRCVWVVFQRMFKELLSHLCVSAVLILVNMSSGHVCPSSLTWRYLLLSSRTQLLRAGPHHHPLPDPPSLLWNTSPAFSGLRGSLGMQGNCPHINYLQDQPEHAAYREHMPRAQGAATTAIFPQDRRSSLSCCLILKAISIFSCLQASSISWRLNSLYINDEENQFSCKTFL